MTTAFALAAFVAVLLVLTIRLRDDPRSVGLAPATRRMVVVRRVYETVVYERVVGAAAATARPMPATVSAPSMSIPAPVAPVATRTS
jgi:hypothetical protein